ncbi:MAG: BTAD domain-containing putative transcriptional regulator [Chloroflexota bacterium]
MSVLKMSFFGPGQVLLPPPNEVKIRSRKEYALLAYLAVEHDRSHNRESILGLLWPELEQKQARNNLRVSLARLRKVVDHSEPPLILSDRHTLRFDQTQLEADGAAWLDVAEFNRYLALVQSHDHVDATQCPTCLADMAKAADLYQGEFLQGFHLEGCESFDHWLLVQRERFHMQAMDLLPRLESAHMATQNWQAAEKTVRHRLSLDSLDEDAHRTLIQILSLSGLRNAALAHYDICVRLFHEELGIEPNEETVALIDQIRKGNLRLKIDDFRLGSDDNPASSKAPGIVNPQSKIINLDPYAILSRLDPLPDQALFGVEKAIETVGNAIDAADRSWLVSIEGIGGLGKTTLAHALVRERLETDNLATLQPCKPAHLLYQDIGWVSAKQEEYLPDRGVQSTGKPALNEESLMDQLLAQLSDGPYPTGSAQEKRLALTRLLKEKTCLVVVDNLETATDYQALLPLMRHLANPSKFLITSRMSVAGQGDVFCYSLSELSEEDALRFLRNEAETRGMEALIASSDEQLRSIYATVGGNPLALKLVLGQLQFLPLNQILTSLRQADSERADQLYTYIYWQAWQMLDATSRHLLLCLPVVPNATFTQLQTITSLELDALQRAIMKLRDLSLVEIGGDLNELRYRLHRLTETFLIHEVVKWQGIREQGSKGAGLQGGMDSPISTHGDGLQEREETQYFIQRVLYMVEQWSEAEAVQEVDVAILDHEYDSVVKAISLGIELDEGWDIVKPLIIAFTPFMERRGHWHTWHSILERAIEAAHRVADPSGEITLTALLARLCQRESRYEDVVYYYRRVIRMARRTGNRFEEARACSNLGYAYIDGGHWWRSEVLSCHALQIFEELGSDHGRAHTHNHLGLLFTRRERLGDAEANLRTACTIWEENGDSHSLIYGRMNLGLLFLSMEKPQPALEWLDDAGKLAEQNGERSAQASIWNNIAFAHRLGDDWKNANVYAKKAEDYFRYQSDYFSLAHVWNNLGLIAHGMQNHDTAVEYLQKSLELHKNLNNQSGIVTVQQEIERVAA